MFPLNSNMSYIKDNGERDKLGNVIGSGSGSELPTHSVADAGKVLTVGEDGSLEWDTKGSGGGLYRGTTPPAANLGSDGDVYVQSYAAGMISNSGQGYIKTGIKPNAGYTIKVSAKTGTPTTNYETIFGTRDGNNSRFTARFSNAGSYALGAQWSSGAGVSAPSTSDYPNVTKSGMSTDFKEIGLQDKGYMLVNGEIVNRNGTASVANYNTFPYDWYLLALNDAGSAADYMVGSIKYCKIYDENKDIAAYIVPAMNGEIPTMYDLVSGVFCESGNTGDLTVTLSDADVEGLYWTKVNGSWTIVAAI